MNEDSLTERPGELRTLTWLDNDMQYGPRGEPQWKPPTENSVLSGKITIQRPGKVLATWYTGQSRNGIPVEDWSAKGAKDEGSVWCTEQGKGGKEGQERIVVLANIRRLRPDGTGAGKCDLVVSEWASKPDTVHHGTGSLLQTSSNSRPGPSQNSVFGPPPSGISDHPTPSSAAPPSTAFSQS